MSVDFTDRKLLLHGERVAALLRGEDIWPVQIELSPTGACNLRCDWCIDYDFRHAFPGSIPLDVLMPALQTLRAHGTQGLVIEGGGEPTLYPRFEALVKQAAGLGYHLGLTTNGTRLLQVRELMPYFRWMRVSLDAYCAKGYAELKGSPLFDEVMLGIEQLTNLRRVIGYKTRIGVSFLISPRQSDPEALRDLVIRLRELAVQYVQFKRVGGMEIHDVGPLQRFAFLEDYGTPSFQVIVQPDDPFQPGNGGLPCLAHALSVQIAGSGDVFLCCRLRDRNNGWLGRIGNLNEETIEEIWQGTPRMQVSSSLRHGWFCQQHCPTCRMDKYNEALDACRRTRQTAAFV